MRSCDISALFMFILFVWMIGISSNVNANEVNKKKYDFNSVEQNQKILQLLLRLAFHTANHIVRLKDAAKVRAENEVDKDLHDITMNDVIQGVAMDQHYSNLSRVGAKKSQTDTDASEIGGRFFSLRVPSYADFVPVNKIENTLKHIASGNMSEINKIANNVQSLANEGVEVLKNVQKTSDNTLNQTVGQVSNPDNSSNSTNIQETAKKMLSPSTPNPVQSIELPVDEKIFHPSFRITPDSGEKNSTNIMLHNVNRTDKIEGRFDSIIENMEATDDTIVNSDHTNESSSSTVMKRETSPVPVSVSSHATNRTSKDHISDGNFSHSNITDSSNSESVNDGDGERAVVLNSLQSRISLDTDNGMNCAEETPDIFHHIFGDYDIEEDDFESDVVKLIGEMELQEISNRLIDILQPS